MITFSTAKGAACEVAGSKFSFLVFPADIVADRWCLLSHPKEENIKQVVSWPGEYDFGGMIMRGIGQQDGRQVSYSCELEGVRFAFIDAPVLDWSDSDLQLLGDIDVLVLVADDAKKITALVEAVDPRVVLLIPSGACPIAAVTKALGSTVQSVTAYKVKAGSLPAEARQVVVLEE